MEWKGREEKGREGKGSVSLAWEAEYAEIHKLSKSFVTGTAVQELSFMVDIAGLFLYYVLIKLKIRTWCFSSRNGELVGILDPDTNILYIATKRYKSIEEIPR